MEKEELEAKRLEFETQVEERRLRLEEARLELERQRVRLEGKFAFRHMGVLITAMVSLAAVLVSVMQFVNSQTAQESQLRAKLFEYVSEHYERIYSTDLAQRTRMKNVLAVTFPTDITRALYKNLDDQILMTELLAPMMVHLERTKRAFNRWTEKNLYLEARVIRESNIAVRDLLLSNYDLVPLDLREDANKLIEHYDHWLEEFDRVRGGTEPAPDTPFVFAGPSGFPFPAQSERRFSRRFNDLETTFYGTATQFISDEDKP